MNIEQSNHKIIGWSYFVEIPNTDNLFVIISKNGCSTLKGINQNKHELNEELHKDQNRKLYKNWITNDNYKKCVVWRDPIERWVSIWNNRLYWNTERYWGGDKVNSVDIFIDITLNEIYNRELNNLISDEHFIPQYYWYNLDDIDTVVDIKDLDNYFNELGVTGYTKLNVSPKTEKTLHVEDLTEIQLNKLKNIYAIDYLLYEEIKKSGKLYESTVLQ